MRIAITSIVNGAGTTLIDLATALAGVGMILILPRNIHDAKAFIKNMPAALKAARASGQAMPTSWRDQRYIPPRTAYAYGVRISKIIEKGPPNGKDVLWLSDSQFAGPNVILVPYSRIPAPPSLTASDWQFAVDAMTELHRTLVPRYRSSTGGVWYHVTGLCRNELRPELCYQTVWSLTAYDVPAVQMFVATKRGGTRGKLCPSGVPIAVDRTPYEYITVDWNSSWLFKKTARPNQVTGNPDYGDRAETPSY
jgi:hypothetical protein